MNKNISAIRDLILALMLSSSLAISIYAQNDASAKPKVIDAKAPTYPAIALAARASGVVEVLVTIAPKGNVIKATAISGHALLKVAGIRAANS